MQALELNQQELSNQLNKEIVDEIKKQNEIKTQIAQNQQILDPEIRNEYNEKVNLRNKN